ncbi:MAG: hypothetical protein LAQ30_09370 [Acidobacteriia bacterium]|nr:hypothetical protein [Terriglobia bacterium]
MLAQSLALAAEGHHHNSSEHCCLLCHLGPLAAVQSSTPAPGIPRIETAYLIVSEKTCAPHGVALPALSSRAPPA